MRILTSDLVNVPYDHGEVHNLSVGFLELSERLGTSSGLAAMASAMTLGRLLSPDTLDEDDERDFIEAVLEFAGAYFVEGGVN